MSALSFVLREQPPMLIDLAGLTPASLAGRSLAAIARLPLGQDRRPPQVGELFTVRGRDAAHLVFEGLTPACLRLGADLEGGLIEATGEAGAELGRGMLSGEIRLRGNAGEAAGAGMRGGRIAVSGNVGARLGGLATGATRGMNGGVIKVGRHAGARAGERMRRGLILIGGDAGQHAGDRMLAGTIVVLGNCGPHVGLGNRRGTLMLATAPAAMTPTFNDCGEFELALMPVFESYVAGLDRVFGRRLQAFTRTRRWCGDMAYGGKGEILLAATR